MSAPQAVISSRQAIQPRVPLSRAGKSAGLPTFSWLRTDRWTVGHAVAATLAGLLGVLATNDVWQEIFRIAWKDPEYSHIYLVPLVAMWMVFVRRLRFRHCKPAGRGLGFVIAAVGWGVMAFGYYHGFQSLRHGGAILVVLGCVVSVLGKQVLFRFFPAIAVLVFMVPAPAEIRLRIALPLQTWTAEISQSIFQVLGVPIDRSENRLTINGTPIGIVEACNGLRMVFALILVSYTFSFGLPLQNFVRFIVVLASPLSAIFCNVVRIIPTVWIYGYFSNVPEVNEHAGRVFHDVSGWLMLPISFLILLGILRVLRWAMIPVMQYTLAS